MLGRTLFLLRDRCDIEQAMDVHGTTVWRVCLACLRSTHDAQDGFQDTFLKYALADDVQFASEEHRKAWLIKVASNRCKDLQRRAWRRDAPLDDPEHMDALAVNDPFALPDSPYRDVLEAFARLDDPPRTPLYLAVGEGYSAPEIAELLGAPVNTVYSWISRGKKQLKEALK